ncbi:hypothetical protein KPSA1_03873 [Pseudomonas syringae pv. actinidiae]|uniref:Uncharacterized protein n=1 Tax=Pseudomonas syringae pv. actinidiae TaxID=103796 RepID=A0A2V0QJG2_PSESF|nr:hypothetical protein KPSA1_03873 [Pseudomonas syringae pv. actinidiae]
MCTQPALRLLIPKIIELTPHPIKLGNSLIL